MTEESLKHKTKIAAYWKALEQIGHYGIQFIVGIVMARLLTPEDYGITALPAVFISIASLFVDCGFTNALIRKPNVTEKDLSTSFYYSIIVGIICYFIIYFSSPWIAKFYNVPILETLMRITALTFFISPLNTPLIVILQRRMDFKTPARINILTKIFGGVLGIICAYMGLGLWSLVVLSLSSAFLNFLITWFVVKWIPHDKWSMHSFKYLFSYGNKILATFLIDRIYMNITPIIIGKFYSPTQLGVYNRALGYAQLPSQQLTGVVSSVTFPALCKVQDNDLLLATNYRKMLRFTAFIIFPIMTLLYVLAEPFIILLITDKWIECVPYLQLMCIWWIWSPIHSLNLNILLVKGRSDLFLKIEIIKKSIGLVIMCVTLPMGIIPFLYGSIINSIIALFINTYYTGKMIHVDFFRQMMDLIPLLFLSIVMGVCVMTINSFVENLLIQAIIGIVVGGAIYLALSILLKRQELEDLKYMLNRK